MPVGRRKSFKKVVGHPTGMFRLGRRMYQAVQKGGRPLSQDTRSRPVVVSRSRKWLTSVEQGLRRWGRGFSRLRIESSPWEDSENKKGTREQNEKEEFKVRSDPNILVWEVKNILSQRKQRRGTYRWGVNNHQWTKVGSRRDGGVGVEIYEQDPLELKKTF